MSYREKQKKNRCDSIKHGCFHSCLQRPRQSGATIFSGTFALSRFRKLRVLFLMELIGQSNRRKVRHSYGTLRLRASRTQRDQWLQSCDEIHLRQSLHQKANNCVWLRDSYYTDSGLTAILWMCTGHLDNAIDGYPITY